MYNKISMVRTQKPLTVVVVLENVANRLDGHRVGILNPLRILCTENSDTLPQKYRSMWP